MRFYTTVFNMCIPNPTGGNCFVLYEKYNKIFEEYITTKVLPSLQGKKDEALLQELEKRWSNHNAMNRWLSRFFHYLHRYFVPVRQVPPLKEAGLLSFYNLIFGEMNNQVRDAVLSMIDREREGEDIDQALVKNVLAIYVDFGQGSMKYYEKDFEEAMFKDTASFYSTKASNWLKNESYKDYMLKVECCLKHERDTVSGYLQNRSQERLLEIVENELLSVYASELKEKKQTDAFPLTEKSI
ncbi:cullin-1-like [Durio zibethinus]|uniref:Cullin-1-like n=1 Tax=Durio zibethinus TaxID=66656 RepID=A0A6P6A6G6_DURZI|nr:cullin-1-like [Durio zibethinus]